MIYLDNAATTMVSDEVIAAMRSYEKFAYGNPGSIHSMGRDAAKAIARARKQVAKPIGANPENIIFTSGGSESNSLAIVGLANYLKSKGKTHIITSTIEHPSVLEAIKALFYMGFEVTYLPVNEKGYLPASNLIGAIRDDTGLVSIMSVNNETGNQLPTHSIGLICHQKNVLFHTDCVQGYGCTDIDVEDDCIDFLSVSGHKFHAPKGAGFLYARKKELLSPIIYGGGQEFGLRSGTENVASIVGLGIAAKNMWENAGTTYKRNNKLRNLLISLITSEVSGVHINGNPYEGSKTVNLRFDDVDGETLVLLLDALDIIVSAGSACSAHSALPSHVLTALGLSEKEAKSSIRISFSDMTTEDEVRIAAKRITTAVKDLRNT